MDLVKYEEKRGIKDDCKDFGLRNCKEEVIIKRVSRYQELHSRHV